MKNSRFPMIITLLAIFILSSTTLWGQDYLWPTEASRYMTSSFCEFRPRHYHAALDIKTWRRNGYKIFAVADGHVYRLRVSANGYGKAVYLKLNDGNYVVYAHLDGFSPALEEFAEAERFRRRENVLDIFLKPDQFPVKRGQHLGYTGDTGIGVPHLHFEIRNRYNQPVNPLQFYPDTIQDKIAPRSKFLAVIPLSARTLVNFAPDTLIVRLKEQRREVLAKPIYLTGPAYLALRGYDLADGNANRFDIYRAEMWINDSLVYRVRYDRFSYQETRLIELDKNFSLWRKGMRFFHNFYRHPANSLPFYGQTPRGAGLLSAATLRPGLNQVVIKQYDFFGNENRVQVPVFYHPIIPVSVESLQTDPDYLVLELKSPRPLQDVRLTSHAPNGRLLKRITDFRITEEEKIRSSFHYYLVSIPNRDSRAVYRLQAEDSRGLPILPVYFDGAVIRTAGNDSPHSDRWTFFPNSARVEYARAAYPGMHYRLGRSLNYRYRADAWMRVYSYEKERNRLPGFAGKPVSIIPGRTNRVVSEDGQLRLNFPANAVYDTIHVTVTAAAPYPALPAPYRYLSPLYDVQPFDQPLNYGAMLAYRIPDSLREQPGLGLYYWDLRKGWLYLPTDYQAENRVFSARVTSLEKFTVIQDTLPPTITPVNLSAFSTGRQTPKWLRFTIRDEMAGIYKETQIEVFLDDRWMIFEYDPEERRISIPGKYISPGEHTVRIRARDNAGNQTVSVFTVRRR